jgi:hypothetical protein
MPSGRRARPTSEPQIFGCHIYSTKRRPHRQKWQDQPETASGNTCSCKRCLSIHCCIKTYNTTEHHCHKQQGTTLPHKLTQFYKAANPCTSQTGNMASPTHSRQLLPPVYSRTHGAMSCSCNTVGSQDPHTNGTRGCNCSTLKHNPSCGGQGC